MDFVLHLLADAATGTHTIVGKYGAETIFGLALAAVVTALWQLYVRVAKPAQDAAIKVAEFNCTSAMASRDGMQAFERASVTQKAIAEQEQRNLDRHEKLIERQERVTERLVAHAGDTGEDNDGGQSVRSAPRSKL